jgi:hypothetical protein
MGMTFFILIIYSSITFSSEINCQYGDNSFCPKGFYCIQYEKDKDVCVENFTGEVPKISYPFDKKTKSICDQGNLSPIGNSHTWNNTAFALDLQGNRKNKENKIYAGADGVVIVHSDCQTKNDQCGAGFGNHVKILTQDNFIIFYAHLAEIKIKTGDKIKSGDLIGFEGETGWTGENNRHLHLSVHFDWKTLGMEYWKNLGHLPKSIPFLIMNCHGEVLNSKEIPCQRISKDKVKALCE